MTFARLLKDGAKLSGLAIHSPKNEPAHAKRVGFFCWRLTLAAFFIAMCTNIRAADTAPLRAGMIGLDTSHVPAFAKIFNNAQGDGDLTSIRVVAGYPGGTDLPASRDRVKG